MFNFIRKRQEQNSATDTVVQAILDAAAMEQTGAIATSAVEIAAGMVGRAFCAATVNSSIMITHEDLYNIGHSLLRTGEYVAVLREMDSEIRLLQCVIQDIKIDDVYVLGRNEPNNTWTLREQADRVIHIKYGARENKSWRGVAPHELAAVSSSIYAQLSDGLRGETNTPTGYILPIPGTDGKSERLGTLEQTLKSLKGRLALVESRQSLAQNAGFVQQKDWSSNRIGAQIRAENTELYKELRNEILMLCGVPLSLVIGGGTGQRESWRQFLFGTINPLALIVMDELRRFDSGFEISFDELRASDLQGRARAFQSMVKAGMEIERAAALSGLMQDD